jgi:hypothetical protein
VHGTAHFIGKPCVTCGQTKRYMSCRRCVDCERIRTREKARLAYRKLPKDVARDANLRTKYGISLVKRDAMLADQDGRCAICFSDSHGHKDWHVDHDHVTGTVRAILCGRCNPGLGHFRDKPGSLLSAVVYLGNHGTPFIATPISDWLKANPL